MKTNKHKQAWICACLEKGESLTFHNAYECLAHAQAMAVKSPGVTYRVLKIVADYTAVGLEEELYSE